MESYRCPKCDSSTVMPGIVSSMGEGGSCSSFVPHGTLPSSKNLWRAGVNLPYGFLACLSCGHLWSSLAPEDVRALIREHGTELAKQHLESLDSGPLHDLPDTPGSAREAGQRVAELDALCIVQNGAGSDQAIPRVDEDHMGPDGLFCQSLG